MAKQLYDYWFIQFDFPDANGRPYKSSGGKMLWNEKLKREIPEGWIDSSLDKLANITMGQSPDGTSYNTDGEGVIFYQGSTDFGIRFPSIRQYTTSPKRFAKKGDILMSVRAPVGTLNIANNDCCIGRGLASLNSKRGSLTHLYYVLNDLKSHFDSANSSGTTFGSITKDELTGLCIIMPPASILDQFEKCSSSVFDEQMLVGEQIEILRKQRDELLPLLMTGQISVTQLNNDLAKLSVSEDMFIAQTYYLCRVHYESVMKDTGYVYILTNPSFKEDWVKIGMCSTPVEQRVKQLDSTGVPLPFEIFATMQTSKYKQAEKLIHSFISKFTNLRIRNNREFFNVKPEEALEIFKQVATVLDDAVIDETYMSSMFTGGDDVECKHHKTPSAKTQPRDEVKKWMIPANSKYFDLEACFNKLGYVYWRQYYNFQTGDTIYIYVASPESAVRYKCIVEGHDLPFSSEMEVEKEFYVKPEDFESSRSHNRYMRLRLQASTKDDSMTMVHLLEHGMNRAPQGCLNLSHPGFAELLEYVERNF